MHPSPAAVNQGGAFTATPLNWSTSAACQRSVASCQEARDLSRAAVLNSRSPPSLLALSSLPSSPFLYPSSSSSAAPSIAVSHCLRLLLIDHSRELFHSSKLLLSLCTFGIGSLDRSFRSKLPTVALSFESFGSQPSLKASDRSFRRPHRTLCYLALSFESSDRSFRRPRSSPFLPLSSESSGFGSGSRSQSRFTVSLPLSLSLSVSLLLCSKLPLLPITYSFPSCKRGPWPCLEGNSFPSSLMTSPALSPLLPNFPFFKTQSPTQCCGKSLAHCPNSLLTVRFSLGTESSSSDKKKPNSSSSSNAAKGIWVRPDWLTSLVRSLSRDDSGIPVARSQGR